MIFMFECVTKSNIVPRSLLDAFLNMIAFESEHLVRAGLPMTGESEDYQRLLIVFAEQFPEVELDPKDPLSSDEFWFFLTLSRGLDQYGAFNLIPFTRHHVQLMDQARRSLRDPVPEKFRPLPLPLYGSNALHPLSREGWQEASSPDYATQNCLRGHMTSSHRFRQLEDLESRPLLPSSGEDFLWVFRGQGAVAAAHSRPHVNSINYSLRSQFLRWFEPFYFAWDEANRRAARDWQRMLRRTPLWGKESVSKVLAFSGFNHRRDLPFILRRYESQPDPHPGPVSAAWDWEFPADLRESNLRSAVQRSKKFPRDLGWERTFGCVKVAAEHEDHTLLVPFGIQLEDVDYTRERR